MREKEEKAMLEAKQQEEEKKAMQEAEELREQVRCTYVLVLCLYMYVCMYRTICLLDRSRVYLFLFLQFCLLCECRWYGMGWDGQRRKDYARKQKEKLLNYQKNFITEAGKIQELMDLGIDPQLLMKS